MKYAIGLLTADLDNLKRAKEKSFMQFSDGTISLKIHETHCRNLDPKIVELTEAVNILQFEIDYNSFMENSKA